MVARAWISLHEWNLLAPMEWVGLDNYADLLTDPRTARGLPAHLYYIAGYLPLVYVGGLALALALNQKLKGRSFLRGVYFLPVVTSWVVVALVWKWLLNPTNGLVNTVLGCVRHRRARAGGPIPPGRCPSIILASAWKDLGFVMVILLAGLQAIIRDLVDAARRSTARAPGSAVLADHAAAAVSPRPSSSLVISLINGFQVFDQVYAMTGGGPAGASQVVVQQIYDLTFRYGGAGEASALSWILFAVILLSPSSRSAASGGG